MYSALIAALTEINQQPYNIFIFWSPSCWLAICPSVCDAVLFNLMEIFHRRIAANIDHVNWKKCKCFQGQVLKVKVDGTSFMGTV